MSVLVLCLMASLLGISAAGRDTKGRLHSELEARLKALEAKVKTIEMENAELRDELVKLDDKNVEVDMQYQTGFTASPTPVPGAVYTRWGRQVCTGDSTLIYGGFMATQANFYNGSGTNYLCLHDDPEWGSFIDGDQTASFGRGVIYGIEYQGNPNQIFDDDNLIGGTFEDQNVPCSVCELTSRSVMLRIDGRRSCPAGWTIEYWGYLSSSDAYAGRSEYACVDHAPEARNGGSAPQLASAYIYHVEARCGSMDCPSYVDNREITCVVCSR